MSCSNDDGDHDDKMRKETRFIYRTRGTYKNYTVYLNTFDQYEHLSHHSQSVLLVLTIRFGILLFALDKFKTERCTSMFKNVVSACEPDSFTT